MMLSPFMIKAFVANMKLAIRDEAHFKQLTDGLFNAIKDEHLDGSFDCFAFAWGLLPQWAKVLLLSMAYRENKNAFNSITPLTPIDLFTVQQRAVLSTACEKLLSAVITLMADYDFTEGFYQGWMDGRSSALNQQPQPQLEKAA